MAENYTLAARKFATIARDINVTFTGMSEHAKPSERTEQETHDLIAAQDVALASVLAFDQQQETGARSTASVGTGVGIGTHEVEGYYGAQGKEGIEDIDPVNLMLQTVYRKAIEYRFAHSRLMRHNAFWADFISFSVLIASTAAGLILFMGDRFATICAIIAATITGLNAYAKYMDFSGKTELHTLSMKDFGYLQRDSSATC